MANRGGLSLSVKMILTTTLLIVVTVVGSGVLNVINVRRVFDDTRQRQVDGFRSGREQLGEVGAPLFARAVQQLVIDRGRDPEILELVKETVAQDTKPGDLGLALAYVLDLNQRLIAHCAEDQARLDCVLGGDEQTGGHRALGEVVKTPLTTASWTQALAAWQAAATGAGPPLVRFDVAGERNNRYRIFAYPIFIGAPATAAGAIAAERPDARQGYVVLGYDLAPIERFAVAAETEKADTSARALLYTGAVGAMFVLIGTVLAIFQGLSITRPIKQLAWKADQIARGDLEARVEIKSRDEIGFLGENFNFMADQIAILLQQTAEKARIEQELEVARTIQETLVPSPNPVDTGVLSFAGFYQPAAQTGGDWWTWHELVGDKFLLVVGDVTGHGVPSAMITAAAKAACDVARHIHGHDVTVTRLLELMNHAIFSSAQRKFVMTCFASIIDTRTRTITYANAGHNFPYLLRGGEFGSLMIRGNRLGDDPTSRYEARTQELAVGDVLVWYTDGIVECDNASREEYGERRFRASVKRASHLPVGEMRDAIVRDAAAYYGDTPRRDDITLIAGRIA